MNVYPIVLTDTNLRKKFEPQNDICSNVIPDILNLLIPDIFVEHAYNFFTVSYEKSRIVSLTSSVMKNISVFPVISRFAVKLICFIGFESASIDCFLLRFIAINFCFFLKFAYSSKQQVV